MHAGVPCQSSHGAAGAIHTQASPAPAPPPSTGGTEPADVSDESIRDAAKFAVDHLNSEAGAELRASLSLPAGKLSLVALKSARTQVVSGLMYYLDEIEITVAGSAAPVTVSAVVWFQAWMPTQYMLLEVAVAGTEPGEGMDGSRMTLAGTPHARLSPGVAAPFACNDLTAR
jgi:hypothetical protein